MHRKWTVAFPLQQWLSERTGVTLYIHGLFSIFQQFRVRAPINNIYTAHAELVPCFPPRYPRPTYEKTPQTTPRIEKGMVGARQGRGMATLCVNQTRPHCVNQMGKTRSKPLATRHSGKGTGAAWAASCAD